MTEFILSGLAWVFAASGAFFVVVGALGTLRMPDFFTRVHATSLIDSLGAILILFALLLVTEISIISFKLVLIILFLLITAPVATHAICKTIRHHTRHRDDEVQEQRPL